MNEEKIQKQIDHIEETVDTLARAVAQGFENITNEFVKVRTEMNTGFEGVNGKIDGLHRRIDAELERTLQLETRVVKVEEAIGITK
jgi:uncharacterized protein YoxC